MKEELLNSIREMRDSVLSKERKSFDDSDLDEGKRVKIKKRRGAKAEGERREARAEYRKEKATISRKRKKERKTLKFIHRQQIIKQVGQEKKGTRRGSKIYRRQTGFLGRI